MRKGGTKISRRNIYHISCIHIYIYTDTYNPPRSHNMSTSGWENAMSKEAKNKLLQVSRN